MDPNSVDRETLIAELREDVVEAYDEREEELGDELMRALERFMLLQIIDERWREHLHDMDYLREGIHLRGFAQIDPLVAYKNEGFEMFSGLMNSIWEEFARYIFNVEVEVEGENGNAAEPAQLAAATGGDSSSTGAGRSTTRAAAAADQPSALAEAAARAAVRARRPATCEDDERRGRRAPAGGRDRARWTRGPDRPQRPVLVRLRQEVQDSASSRDSSRRRKCHGAIAPVASATS